MADVDVKGLVERRRKALADAIYRENSLHTAVEYGRDIPDHALDSILAALDGVTPEAATLIEQQSQAAEGLVAYARRASIALARLSGGGSEMFTRIGEEFYADPELCLARCEEKAATRARLTKYQEQSHG